MMIKKNKIVAVFAFIYRSDAADTSEEAAAVYFAWGNDAGNKAAGLKVVSADHRVNAQRALDAVAEQEENLANPATGVPVPTGELRKLRRDVFVQAWNPAELNRAAFDVAVIR